MKFFFARIINHVVANIQQKFHVLGMICSSCKHETVLSQDLHNRARFARDCVKFHSILNHWKETMSD